MASPLSEWLRDGASREEIALALRRRARSVFARIKQDQVLIDPRTVQDGEGTEVAAAVREVLGA